MRKSIQSEFIVECGNWSASIKYSPEDHIDNPLLEAGTRIFEKLFKLYKIPNSKIISVLDQKGNKIKDDSSLSLSIFTTIYYKTNSKSKNKLNILNKGKYIMIRTSLLCINAGLHSLSNKLIELEHQDPQAMQAYYNALNSKK